jgi:hypothetical protein
MKTYRFRQLLVIIFISSNIYLSSAALPGKASITGVVVDKVTGQSIEYANLVLYNQTDSSLVTGSISSQNGHFILTNLTTGTYYLDVLFMGYQKLNINNIEISSKNQTLDLGTLSLSLSSVNLQETTVVANNDYVRFKVDKKVINVSAQAGAEGGVVTDALANVPSIQVDGAGNITLRGSVSFTLLIDGRPSVLDATDALNQIPANSVDKIEIITNPGVKYDADGTTGIINLIMKKQKANGTSGQATVTLATGDKFSGNVMVNQRSKSFRSNISATYSNKRKQTESTDYRETYNGDSTNDQFIASDRDLYWKNYLISGGVSWEGSKKNTWSLDAEVGQWEFDRRINSTFNGYNNYNPDSLINKFIDRFRITNNYVSGNLGYSHQFRKEANRLDVNLYYVKLVNETPNYIQEININDADATSEWVLNSKSNRNHVRLNADYTGTLSEKISMEAGFQSDTKASGSDYSDQFLAPNSSIWITDSIFSGHMDFLRSVNALYGMLDFQINGFDVKTGVRLELNNRLLQETTSRKEYRLNELNIFPSLHISRLLDHAQQLSLSYSRRVNRPNEWMLIPALSSTGRNMLQLGNPELLPAFTHSMELDYSIQNDFILISAELYTRMTNNTIVYAVSERNGVFYQTHENLEQEIASGLELMSNINLWPWWRINLNANAYYSSLKGSLANGYVVDNNSLMWNGSFRTTFIVKGNTYLEFLAIYYGPSIQPQGKSKEFYYFDFFVKRSFLHRSLTVALRSHNTFDTGIYIEDNGGANYIAHTWFKYEGPTFMLTLTYKLNNFKRKNAVDKPDMNFDSGLDH